jgi:hypothetical protein
MGLSVNFPELSRYIELFVKEKICELSSRDGEPGGASVHGGLAVVAPREARRRCRARELAVGWGKRRGALGGGGGSSPRASVAGSMARRGWRR